MISLFLWRADVSDTCKGVTKAGQPCRRAAVRGSYCQHHFISDHKIRLEKQLKAVLDICKAKGWSASIVHSDNENYNYASIVARRLRDPTSYASAEVVVRMDMNLSDGLRISFESASFYTDGIKDLAAAIQSAFPKKKKIGAVAESDGLDRIAFLLNRFDLIARQLCSRYMGRETLEIRDEYDAQDLLHALLKMFFDDIRPEDSVPQRAGSGSRVDFRVVEVDTIIEVKFISKRGMDRKIGDELIIDIERYRNHPACRRLLCFVYDPNRLLSNPRAIEADLSRSEANLKVDVFIRPA